MQRSLTNAKIAQFVQRLISKRDQDEKSYLIKKNAKIAQLVERDLAKVEVAGSSPVFRSNYHNKYILFVKAAWVVKLVDTLDLKSSDCNGRTGSSPVPSTKNRNLFIKYYGFFV